MKITKSYLKSLIKECLLEATQDKKPKKDTSKHKEKIKKHVSGIKDSLRDMGWNDEKIKSVKMLGLLDL